MSKIANWDAKRVFDETADTCLRNAGKFMDVVVSDAKRRCPVDPVTFREGRFSSAAVSFVPRTGKNKGKLITFKTSNRWLGRSPGNLRDSVRKVERPNTWNIRVYAGDYKIYWAFMIERGYHDRAGKYHPGTHFLQNAFSSMATEVEMAIKNGV